MDSEPHLAAAEDPVVGVVPSRWANVGTGRPWRSPANQPLWARPALLAIAAVAAFADAWGTSANGIETFYGGAVRSMSENWHNFFFASFDPWGTISIDKLPGAFWIQALSLKLFGFHIWALLLPQVVEGTLSVLVLYRVVRRVAGAGAGLIAAAVLAITPATVLLNRGNISDTLLILLLLLATDATVTAIEESRWQSLMLAGVWVGLAFQTKMLQSWLVLPGFFVAYLVAAPEPNATRRLKHVVLAGVAVLVVSLSWMTIVTLVPAHDRPYVDGSCNNSLYSQVFLYNGLDRGTGTELTQPGCRPLSPALSAQAKHLSTHDIGTVAVPGGPTRFLRGPFGRLAAWLFLPAMVAAVGLFRVRREQPRTDLVQASVVIWLAWLLFTWSSFASSNSLNSYYLGVLVPPIAALCGMGVRTAWSHRDSPAVRKTLLATVALGSAYALELVPGSAGVWVWVLASTVLLALAAVGLLITSLRSSTPARWLLPAAFVLSVAALMSGPSWASAMAVKAELGPFDTPYQSASLSRLLATQNFHALNEIPQLDAYADRFPSSLSVDTYESSAAAGFEVMVTGHEFLPLGGFTGRVPNPTLPQFIADVRHSRIYRVLVAVQPATNNPDLLWTMAHCAKSPASDAAYVQGGVHFQRYLCTPHDTH
jgi:4-amino-4-deoxy-L-arabinose transferase-like glycosyltransferase